MSGVYYNDIDPYACGVLRARIADGHLPDGRVDERDVREVKANEIKGYRHIHLFAGIGGFPLGLKWAGWPDSLSVVTGGFPCQDISLAGRGEGIDGGRSGLWREMARIIRCVQPEFVLVENVSALLGRGMGVVLGDLASCGYDAEWDCIPAFAVGAPHRRDRVWLVAYAASKSNPEPGDSSEAERDQRVTWLEPGGGGTRQHVGYTASRVAHANCPRREELRRRKPVFPAHAPSECGGTTKGKTWETEPDVGRVAHGVPNWVDRLRCLGNAVVPQVVEMIARGVLDGGDDQTKNKETKQ